jgi:hypothetical protein
MDEWVSEINGISFATEKSGTINPKTLFYDEWHDDAVLSLVLSCRWQFVEACPGESAGIG